MQQRGRRFGAGWRQYAAECRTEWLRVSDLPGVRLRLAGRKIIARHGEVLLSRKRRQLTLATGQVLHAGPRSAEFDVVTGTGEPVLWIRGSHRSREALGLVLLPGQRYLTFPVQGTRPHNAVMTAVNESAATVLRFRKMGPREYEVVVSQEFDITTEVLCIIELTAGWLWRYFMPEDSGSGG